jgi:DNA-directed RNA polymerase II subunit RPB2
MNDVVGELPALTRADVNGILDAYMKEVGIIRPVQTNNFDSFLLFELPAIIQTHSHVSVESDESSLFGVQNTRYDIAFTNANVKFPTTIRDNQQVAELLPSEARLRNCSYLGDVTVDIHVRTVVDGQTVSESVTPNAVIARLPIMVGTCRCNWRKRYKTELSAGKECSYDTGGYFIIKGKERVIIGQERICQNFNFFQKTKNAKYPYICEVRNSIMKSQRPNILQIRYEKSGDHIMLNQQFFFNDIDACYILVCCGLTYDDIIATKAPVLLRLFAKMKTITHDNAVAMLQSVMLSSETSPSTMLSTYFFSNLVGATLHTRCVLLLFLCQHLHDVAIGKCKEDDRDSWIHKRNDMAGDLFRDLFRILFKNYMKQFKVAFKKNTNIESILFKLTSITSGFKVCMNTGNWGVQNSVYKKIGVSQVLNRLTHSSMISHLRRVTSSAGKDGKLTKLRQVHPSQWGIICPSETPEGSACGIVKNFALLTRMSSDVDPVTVLAFLATCDEYQPIESFTFAQFASSTFVFVNGSLHGYTTQPVELEQTLKVARRRDICPAEMSVAYCETNGKIAIYTECGRCMRPLFDLHELAKYTLDEIRAMSWTDLLGRHVILYMDKSEESTCVVDYDITSLRAINARYCDLDASMILGVAGSCIPFADHNQAPRNCYQAAMGKQAIGMFCSNPDSRFDSSAHVLMYPQPPIVQTVGSQMIQLDKLPAGQNVVVAIVCYSGFNQEDSVIMNQSSIDRGLFRSYCYKTLMCEEKKTSSNLIELFGLPSESIRQPNKNYNLLDDDGFVKVGAKIVAGDVLAGKVLYKGDDTKVDMSLVTKSNEEGVVDKVLIVTNEEGLKCAKIKVRQLRVPEMGDKVASRAAQKGTIGITLAAHDMPFTSSGITPDIVINPHCMPSRMTIGQLMECISGKIGALNGTLMDATPFRDTTIESLTSELSKHGFNRHGNEVLYNGFTGEQIKTEVFIGPTYYQRLKHMVADKIHARSHGNIQLLTRQPLEGRSRDGGLRFGEMERDCMIAHGSSFFLKDRLFDQSDVNTSNVCDKCGSLGVDLCQMCNSSSFSTVNMPYATNILTQELQAIGIDVRFKT